MRSWPSRIVPSSVTRTGTASVPVAATSSRRASLVCRHLPHHIVEVELGQSLADTMRCGAPFGLEKAGASTSPHPDHGRGASVELPPDAFPQTFSARTRPDLHREQARSCRPPAGGRRPPGGGRREFRHVLLRRADELGQLLHGGFPFAEPIEELIRVGLGERPKRLAMSSTRPGSDARRSSRRPPPLAHAGVGRAMRAAWVACDPSRARTPRSTASSTSGSREEPCEQPGRTGLR